MSNTTHATAPAPRVVITGVGLVTPLGSNFADFAAALAAGRSGVVECGLLPSREANLSLRFAGEARQFTGNIADFGPLDSERTKAIRKGLKVMCRETQMAIAAAQLALGHAGVAPGALAPERAGVVLGSDYMLTIPDDYSAAILKCSTDGRFDFRRWGNDGLGEMAPLWMLKYLPNMPASHIAILNDLRGPNNSLTMREASSVAAISEAYRTIARGHADVMLAGATGTRVLPMQAIHAMQANDLATTGDDPAAACRPFDRDRSGTVAGEGAAVLVLETLASALARGATPLAEVLGCGASVVADRELRGKTSMALANAFRSALRDAGCTPRDVGHVNAHGLGTRAGDADEAAALYDALGDVAGQVPVVALKSNFGNLGAGSGAAELAGSLAAWQNDSLPRVLNFQNPDATCPVNAVASSDIPPGDVAVKLSVTPQGQAAAIVLSRYVPGRNAG